MRYDRGYESSETLARVHERIGQAALTPAPVMIPPNPQDAKPRFIVDHPRKHGSTVSHRECHVAEAAIEQVVSSGGLGLVGSEVFRKHRCLGQRQGAAFYQYF